MTKIAPATTKTNFEDVMTWGNQSPWKTMGVRLKHKTSFRPEEVVRDGRGNILSMPVLEAKPCFGRPEVVFRQGKRTRKRELPGGRIVDWKNHPCGSCPAGVHEACVRTAHERVMSDPVMWQAFQGWHEDCKTHFNGEFVCIRAASLSWGAFKRAIAARGPFENSNDAEVAKLEQQKRDEQREKWKNRKRLQRHWERALARQEQQLPSGQFVVNLKEERDRRFESLLDVLGRSDQPLSRSRVQPEKREATAGITANAWAVQTLLRASGQNASPGTIARVMVEKNLSAGTQLGTLKTRMPNDLKRADECERDGLWKRFDADADLDDYDVEDDDAADALSEPVNEIDRILRELDPLQLLGIT